MSTLPLDLFFSVPQPAVTDLPHLITALDSELMAKVAHLTRSKLGLWRLPAPFDDHDVYDPWRDAERTPFDRWALPANQAELMGGGRWATEAIFGSHAILLDSALDEPAVAAAAQLRAERRDNGGFYQERFPDWPGLPRLLEITPWALIPVAPERSYGLFVSAPARAEWVEALADWCGRNGRSFCRVVRRDGTAALEDTPAAEEPRARAAAAQIDMFLARMERYFRMGDETVLPRIEERIQAERRRRAEVAQARERKREAAGK